MIENSDIEHEAAKGESGIWIRYGSHLLNRKCYMAFFMRKNRIYGLDTNGKRHLILKYKDEGEGRLSMNLLSGKLRSE